MTDLKHKNGSGRLALPIGISDFPKAVSEYYYVDKTLLIKEFLDTRPQVTLFTRPRRFGKTLNMDMLRTFFEISNEDTSRYFVDKKIWSCGDYYRSHQGRYPVIFMTFKDSKFSGWDETFSSIKSVVQMEFLRHDELKNSGNLTLFEKEYYAGIMEDSLSEVKWSNAMAMLSQMLHKHYGTAPVILIDEYDVPLQQGHMLGFYDEAVTFLRNFFSAGVKDNPNLSYAFMTGVLRVAKESIFSGMNNLKVHSILDERYGEYFGFTVDEVKSMLNYYGLIHKFDEACEWYDGYRFGNTEIFNPWSVINYIDEGCFPKAFWQSTGSNDIIGSILEEATTEIVESLQGLLQGETLLSYIDTDVAYPQVREKPSSIYSFLLVAGYLKAVKTFPQSNGDYMCEVAIPNKEISLVYSKEILSKLEGIIPQSSAIALQQSLFMQDAGELQRVLQKFLIQTISSHDAANEVFYHGLLVGLCAVMNGEYYLTSNREAGEGRYDIQMMPRKNSLPGFIIEIKALHGKVQETKIEEKLEELVDRALEQIDRKQYISELKEHGCSNVVKMGIAFYGKHVRVEIGS